MALAPTLSAGYNYSVHTKTLKLRVRDKHCNELNQQARQINLVWNYVNELSSRCIKERGEFLSNFDIQKYTNGASKELGLHSQTVQCVSKEYVTRRKQFKKRQLNWRKSFGVRRSLGWIPVNCMATLGFDIYFDHDFQLAVLNTLIFNTNLSS